MDQEQTTTPRVNKELLPNYIGRTVRLVGTVKGKRSDGTVEIQTCDKGSVLVKIAGSSDDYDVDTVCEIIGKVGDDLSIEEYNVSVWSPDFNMENFNQLVCCLIYSHSFTPGTSHP